MYVFGGTNGAATLNDVEILDTATGRWLDQKQPKKQPPGRFAHSMVAVGDELVVFGGITFEEDLNDVSILAVSMLSSNLTN